MGKAEEATKKRKKKGRPSLLDLQKRSLRLQQKQQQEEEQASRLPNPTSRNPNPPPLPYPNCIRRSTRRNPNPAAVKSPVPESSDEEDDERREKKLKLVTKLPNQHHPRSSAASLSLNCGSDSSADAKDPDASRKVRKINAAGDRSGGADAADKGEKVRKATDTPQGTRLETGPTTPLPDKKLLVFILDRLQKKDTYGVYSEPVDPNELPDYHEIIEHPMDFGTVRKKLDGGLYSNLEQFEADVYLICANAMEYNSPDTIYFRQARSIHELAKRDFENLRQESDHSDSQPKVVRRGRPPTKHLKKSFAASLSVRQNPDSSSGATLASGEDPMFSNSYNLRKGPTTSKLRTSDATFGSSHKARSVQTYSSWSDRKNDISVSILKGSSIKLGKQQCSLDDNPRDTYMQYEPASCFESPVLTALDGELKHLMEVGLDTDHGYARSLARFAADLGPVVWKIASKKIQRVLPAGIKFGPGWVEENEEPLLHSSSLHEMQISLTNSMYEDNHSAPLPPPPYSSPSSASQLFHNSENVMQARGLNSQSTFCSLGSGFSGAKPENSLKSQQRFASQADMNAFSGGCGFSPQMGLLTPTTSTTDCISNSEGGSLPQMFGMATGSSHLIGSSNAKRSGSDGTHLSGIIGRVHSGNFTSPNVDPGSNIMPDMVVQGRPFWQELSHQLKQDSLPVAPDLNVRFQSPGTPNTNLQIRSPQHPDLALQL